MGVRRKFNRDLAEKLLAKHCPNGAPVQVEVISGHYGIELNLERVDDDLFGFLYRDDSGHSSKLARRRADRSSKRAFV